MKISSIAIFIVFLVLLVGGSFGVLFLHNTFVIENTAAAPHQPVVYLTAEDLNTNPQELVAPKPNTTLIEVLSNEVGYLNVRAGSGISNAKVARVKPGDELEYIEVENNWYHIVLAEDKTGWVSGDYVKEIEKPPADTEE